jgi:hypothetical protein
VLNKKIKLLLRETSGSNKKEEEKKEKTHIKQEKTGAIDKEIVQDALDIFGGEVIREE